ncbi:Hypothetical protein NTJ_03462 [Nesidiocoris tenuis]|uniref:Uncharacterized protein n=1 Tax=Nesidiocoris tenuis TaxID=355587 RepID=A0ABN7AEH8_9HEMI|nr:Hypothetical protein NTJ_03462 [Nesidiocoris tenuis]
MPSHAWYTPITSLSMQSSERWYRSQKGKYGGIDTSVIAYPHHPAWHSSCLKPHSIAPITGLLVASGGGLFLLGWLPPLQINTRIPPLPAWGCSLFIKRN